MPVDMDEPLPDLPRYEIKARIFTNRPWVHYIARSDIGREVIVRVLQPDYFTPTNVARFRRDLACWSRLTHLHVLSPIDGGIAEETCFLVTPFIEGETVSQMLARGPLDVATAVGYLRQAALGLGYIHSQGMVCLGVAPRCLHVDRSGVVRLDDMFCTAYMKAGEEEDSGSNRVCGVPAYMSPEAAQGLPLDGRSDLYSLGCVFYTMLTGQRVYQGDARKVIILQVTGEIPTLRAARADLPASLEPIVQRLLAKKPDQRYQSAEEVIEAMEVPLQPPFQAYAGDQPFAFVSYAHKDAEWVYPELRRLHDMGMRIWYDEGIDPGNEWPEDVARALDHCSLFLVFISPRAVESKNVRNEINFAINHDKPFLAIHIEETTLPKGLELRMGEVQAILRWRMPEDRYVRQMEKTLRTSAVLRTQE